MIKKEETVQTPTTQVGDDGKIRLVAPGRRSNLDAAAKSLNLQKTNSHDVNNNQRETNLNSDLDNGLEI